MGDGADYAKVLRARARMITDNSRFPEAADVQLVFNTLAYIVENLPTPTQSGRQERRDRLAQYNPRRPCTCGHPLGTHATQGDHACYHGADRDGKPCGCNKFTEPVSDVSPCFRSSNCILTHNHLGDCELRYQ